MKTLDEDQFSHFKEIPCDKCGSISSYDPSIIDEVMECFGCKCKRLQEMQITCECGWTGNYFEQLRVDLDKPSVCPKCFKLGHNE